MALASTLLSTATLPARLAVAFTRTTLELAGRFPLSRRRTAIGSS